MDFFLKKLEFGHHPVSYTHLDVYKRQVYRREVLKGTEKGPLFVKFHRQYNEPILDSPLNTETVSYTHLDVYKRQIVRSVYLHQKH